MSSSELDRVNSNTFITYYGLNNKNDLTRYITMIYYTFTTLATVGFGDYHPCADEEMILAVRVFLSGVSVISYLMGIFSEILKKFQKLNVDFDEGDQLAIFFSLMKKLNGNIEIEKGLKKKIELHFDNKWKTDRN